MKPVKFFFDLIPFEQNEGGDFTCNGIVEDRRGNRLSVEMSFTEREAKLFQTLINSIKSRALRTEWVESERARRIKR